MTPNQAILAKTKADQAGKPSPIIKTLAQWFASMILAKDNCARMRQQAGSDATADHYRDMGAQHSQSLLELTQLLPSGSGIDNGTTFDNARSSDSVLRFNTSFHHMDGWTDHVISVRPAFEGMDITVAGRDRNQIKEYLAAEFHECLQQKVMATFDNDHMSFDVVRDI